VREGGRLLLAAGGSVVSLVNGVGDVVGRVQVFELQGD
jgi:hypothetical protein